MKKIQPFVLYCHGLGASPHNSFAQRAKLFIESRQFRFQSVLYRNVGLKKLWDVDEWLEDILSHLDKLRKSGVVRTILMGFSGGCHGVLRAALRRPEEVCGLFLLAPGVGLKPENYIPNAVPELARKLLEGESVIYPAAKDGFPALVDLRCLQKYSEKCVSNCMEKIPIRCPVRILHGALDDVVPLENVKKFVKKLESTDVEYKVLPEVGHYIPMTKDVEVSFDSLLDAAQFCVR